MLKKKKRQWKGVNNDHKIFLEYQKTEHLERFPTLLKELPRPTSSHCHLSIFCDSTPLLTVLWHTGHLPQVH